jgi:hypothetical protein
VAGHEAWHAWRIATLVLTAPEREDTLPFEEDQEGVFAEESGAGFFVDLLVGGKQAHSIDDESTDVLD